MAARLLVISDTHFIKPTQRLGDEIMRHVPGVDHVIHAGDYTSEGVLNQLEATGKFTGVRGNMDPESIKQRLPEITSIVVKNEVLVGIIHGWGSPSGFVERIHPVVKERGFHVVITGHVHAPFHRMHESIVYINPGSPVDKVFAKVNTYAIVTINGKEDIKVEFIEV